MTRQQEDTEQALPPASINYPAEVVQDLRERLTEAEKKLRGKSHEIRGLKDQIRDAIPSRRWTETVRLDQIIPILVSKKVFRRNDCSICGTQLLWFKTAEKETRWRALTYDGKIHYHDPHLVQTLRTPNHENQDNFNRKTALARLDRTKTFRARRKSRVQTPSS